MSRKNLFILIVILVLVLPTSLVMAKGGKPTPSDGVNNLSYPVIWAEGVTKALPGTAGMTPH